MESKWAKRKALQIQSGQPIPEADIRALRRILKNALNAGNYGRGISKQASPDEAWDLIQLIEDCQPRVTLAQASKGAEWLIGRTFTSRGALRNTAWTRELTQHDVDVIRTCRAGYLLERCALVGLDVNNAGRWVSDVLPIYRMFGERGSFDYVAASWQSGGWVAIVARDYTDNAAAHWLADKGGPENLARAVDSLARSSD